jgi:CRISPR-associated protein Csm4
MKIIYLIPLGGYSTVLRSDTLWGMLCWGIRHLWGNETLDAFIDKAAAGQPEFVVSSAFPFKQHGRERIPFFPNPFKIAPDATPEEEETMLDIHRLRKKFKNIEWLSLEDFEAALKGELTAKTLLDRLRVENRIKKEADKEGFEFYPSGQTVRRTPPELEPNSLTHNTIDRLRGGTLDLPALDSDDPERTAGQLFHAEEFFWRDIHDETNLTPNTGLFFLAHGDTAKLEPILNLFRHWGFGADRTTGKGFFDFEIENFHLDEPKAGDSNALYNLSLYHPTLNELRAFEKSEGCLQYLLERREGYVGGYRERRQKQPRLYFKEGSVFLRPEGFTGRSMGCIRQQEEFIASKSLPHKVWDNGFGLMLNLKWNG